MNKNISLIILLTLFVSCASIQGKYVAKEDVYINNQKEGEILVNVEIEKIKKDCINISFEKKITIYPQDIKQVFLANGKNKEFLYNFIDAWGNNVKGSLFKKNGKVYLYMDCEELSNKNMAVFYGDTIRLEKSEKK